jgi:hypothetical protein
MIYVHTIFKMSISNHSLVYTIRLAKYRFHAAAILFHILYDSTLIITCIFTVCVRNTSAISEVRASDALLLKIEVN